MWARNSWQHLCISEQDVLFMQKNFPVYKIVTGWMSQRVTERSRECSMFLASLLMEGDKNTLQTPKLIRQKCHLPLKA